MKRIYVDVGVNKVTRKLLSLMEGFDESWLFEPNAELAEKARNQVAHLDGVTVVEKAVSDTQGSSVFRVADTDSCSSLLKFSATANEEWVDCRHPIKSFNTVEEYAVEVVRLDGFMDLSAISKIEFLHIDAQGKDLDVVRSLGERVSDVSRVEIEVLSPGQPPLYQGQPGYSETQEYMESVGFVESSRWTQSLDREINITYVRKSEI